MKLPFLDRERERNRLARLFSQGASTFCCLYGRRRCGKSRLLQETLPRDGSVYFVGDEREPPLQREALAASMARVAPGMDQVAYPDWTSLLERWWQDAPPGASLVLDEFPYLVRSSPEIPSLLQRLLDRARPRKLDLLVCGSSQRMMQGLLLDGAAPLYGRAHELIEVKPLGVFWLVEALGLADPLEVLEAYAVWGGVPRYWELAADRGATWDSVADIVLDPMGVLHNEPRRLLIDDMRDTAQAASILALVGSGCNRVSEIAARLAKPATSLNRPLQRLIELGLVCRERPFGESGRSGKRTLYRIDDPFLAFWFRFVEPNRSRLEAGFVDQVAASVRSNFPGHLAGVWEALARKSFAHLSLGGHEWLPACRWWGPGTDRQPLEVDLVAESVDRKCLFVGEAKLRLTAAEADRLSQALLAKVQRLPFAPSYSQVMTGVFVAAGLQASPGGSLVTAREVVDVCR
jgi:AAA+ ATPase superfamily predicted ATPase